MKFLQPKIFVQQIDVIWTKASRGAPLAALRNSVPEALEFSVDRQTLEENQLIAQFVNFDEYSNFAQPRLRFESFATCEKIKYRCVDLQITENHVDVIWHFNGIDGGHPNRIEKAKLAFTLQPKQWGRVLYNGRFSEE